MTSPNDRDLDQVVEDALRNASHWEGSPHTLYAKVRRRLQPVPWYRRFRSFAAVSAAALTLLLSLGIYQYAGAPAPSGTDDKPLAFEVVNTASPLPVVGTTKNLQKLLGQRKSLFGKTRGTDGVGDPGDSDGGFTDQKGYSETNTQVRGVDEADLVKTDGQYIYQIRNQELLISRVFPAERMEVISQTMFTRSFYPQDLYLDANLLTVIVNDYQDSHPYLETGGTAVLVYDITDKAAPVLVRELEVEGRVLSTRKVDTVVYLVTQKMLYGRVPDDPNVYYRDGGVEKKIGLDAIRYFPGINHDAYLTVAALDVADGSREAKVDVYLGSGREIYMSRENLYVALTHWDRKESTFVHKFGISGTDIVYQGAGEVPGTILNQFSMDEHNGYFRIATTQWAQTLINNVYVLDEEMKIVGRLEGLAPDEQIFSARFMGDKGYLVTFELIDPLFVIDLSNPTMPNVLGELKIPGFSNYLHPIDETTLLGIGHDTDVVTRNGSPTVDIKGIKLAIFDVADVANPKELHVEIIGGRGSYSEALDNHKAVLFYNNILSIPVTVFDGGRQEPSGAVVYSVSKEEGFAPMGTVSHSGYNPYNYDYTVRRSLIISDILYTVSNEVIQANSLTDGLPEIKALSLRK